DEFIEIVNTGHPIDLGGATLADSSGQIFVFPPLILDTGDTVVVFGGGTPNFDVVGTSGTWCRVLPDSVTVLAASALSGLGLNNSGDTVTLVASDGTTVLDTVVWGLEGGNDQSLNRSPELDTDAALVRHREIS